MIFAIPDPIQLRTYTVVPSERKKSYGGEFRPVESSVHHEAQRGEHEERVHDAHRPDGAVRSSCIEDVGNDGYRQGGGSG